MARRRVADTLPILRLLGQLLNPETDGIPSVGGDLLVGSAEIDWPTVVVLASRHLITPALHARLGHAGVAAYADDELERYFRTLRELNRSRNQRIRAQVLDLLGALNPAGIEPIFLKGTAHLLLGLYRDGADRVIGDVDLLVPTEQLGKALECLSQVGYRPREGDVEHAHLHHYSPLARADSEVWVEVHKDASPYRRALPTPALIRHARPIRIEDWRAAVPCPEDLLVHNVVHSQLHTRGFWSAEFSLRDAYDLVLLARHFRDEVDWRRLSARLAADVGRNCAGFYVRRAHQLFGQPLPSVPWPAGARFADRRWLRHARGKMLWSQRLSRLVAHELQVLSWILTNPAQRRRSVRRLGDRSWYGLHAGRLRALIAQGD